MTVLPIATGQSTPLESMQWALNAYYLAERNGLPAITGIGLATAILGIILFSRTGRFLKGWGLAFLIAGALVTVGALVYWSQIPERHFYYAQLLNTAPMLYGQQELRHLESMQESFWRIIAADAGAFFVGLSLAVYGAITRRDFVKGFGMASLIAAAALP